MSWGIDSDPDKEPEGTTGGHEQTPESPPPSAQAADRAPEGAVPLFDVEDLNLEWSEWRPGVDYVAGIREAKSGETVLRVMLLRVTRRGSRVRTQSLCTSDGEPVVRADLHPDGWREVADLVADGERYRRAKRRTASG